MWKGGGRSADAEANKPSGGPCRRSPLFDKRYVMGVTPSPFTGLCPPPCCRPGQWSPPGCGHGAGKTERLCCRRQMIACLGPLPFTGLFDTGHRILYYLILGLGPGVGGGQVVLVWGEDLASTTPAFHRPITGPFPITSYTHTYIYSYTHSHRDVRPSAASVELSEGRLAINCSHTKTGY